MTEDAPSSGPVCDRCEPHLELLDPSGKCLVAFDEALPQTRLGLLWGKVMALTGFGHTLYVADSRKESAVSTLRQRTHWGVKALPLLYPTMELLTVDFEVSEFDSGLLSLRQSPAVLLSRKQSPRETAFAFSVAGNNQSSFRVMLPRTPLQRLVLGNLGFPLVAVEERALPAEARTSAGDARPISDFSLTLNCPAYPPNNPGHIHCAGSFCEADWVGVRGALS